MPEGERFWNPYRWVNVGDDPIERDTPSYRHSFSGHSGRIVCELEALTPLLIGSGAGEFVRSTISRKPFVPGTSLKGAIRSLAEVVGHASALFADQRSRRRRRERIGNQGLRLDMVQRMFGYLNREQRFAGLVRFSDASPIYLPPRQWKAYRVVVGRPNRNHNAFYGRARARKFYHHHVGAEGLIEAPSGVTQTARVRPAPPGTRFEFSVQYENLREDELNLLLYCICLEEKAVVQLSDECLGRQGDAKGVRLHGPMRHKIGGSKPHGAGSVRIQIKRIEWTNPTQRYRNGKSIRIQEGKVLDNEITTRVISFVQRQDNAMQELRSMLIYTPEDPRRDIRYPSFEWFRRNPRRSLKPTI